MAGAAVVRGGGQGGSQVFLGGRQVAPQPRAQTQAEQGGRPAGVGREHSAVLGLGAVQPARLAQGGGVFMAGAAVVRGGGEGGGEVFLGSRQVAPHPRAQTQAEQGGRPAGMGRQHGAVLSLGTVQPARLAQGGGVFVAGAAVVRGGDEGGGEVFFRGRQVAPQPRAQAQAEQGGRPGGMGCEHRAIFGLGAVQPARLAQGGGVFVAGAAVVRGGGEGGGQVFLGSRQIAPQPRAQAQA